MADLYTKTWPVTHSDTEVYNYKVQVTDLYTRTWPVTQSDTEVYKKYNYKVQVTDTLGIDL